MLRIFVLSLMLVNGVFFAWTHGWLSDLGFAPAQHTEPQRLKRQINPQAIELPKPQARLQTEAALPAVAKPTECLQAGLFDETQTAALRQALMSTLAAGTWVLESTTVPPRWIVYMGKFASAEAVAKKRSELVALASTLEPLNNPNLEFGLSLGGFATEAQAKAYLATLKPRGVRSARVVLERPQASGMLLRLPSADDAMRARLDELKPVLAGKPLRPC